MTVQGPHDADARKHRRAAERCDQDQRFNRGVAFGRRVLSFRKLRDVIASILERDKLAPAGEAGSDPRKGGAILCQASMTPDLERLAG